MAAEHRKHPRPPPLPPLHPLLSRMMPPELPCLADAVDAGGGVAEGAGACAGVAISAVSMPPRLSHSYTFATSLGVDAEDVATAPQPAHDHTPPTPPLQTLLAVSSSTCFSGAAGPAWSSTSGGAAALYHSPALRSGGRLSTLPVLCAALACAARAAPSLNVSIDCNTHAGCRHHVVVPYFPSSRRRRRLLHPISLSSSRSCYAWCWWR